MKRAPIELVIAERIKEKEKEAELRVPLYIPLPEPEIKHEPKRVVEWTM